MPLTINQESLSEWFIGLIKEELRVSHSPELKTGWMVVSFGLNSISYLKIHGIQQIEIKMLIWISILKLSL